MSRSPLRLVGVTLLVVAAVLSVGCGDDQHLASRPSPTTDTNDLSASVVNLPGIGSIRRPLASAEFEVDQIDGNGTIRIVQLSTGSGAATLSRQRSAGLTLAAHERAAEEFDGSTLTVGEHPAVLYGNEERRHLAWQVLAGDADHEGVVLSLSSSELADDHLSALAEAITWDRSVDDAYEADASTGSDAESGGS